MSQRAGKDQGFRLDPATIAESCRRLWFAVLVEHWRLAHGQGVNIAPFDVSRARGWFGSAGFYEVCELAGVDARKCLRSYQGGAGPAGAGQ
jgi:hypothetical protein